MGQNHLERSYLLIKCKMRLESRFCFTVHMCLKSCFPVDLSTKNIIVFLSRSGLKLGLEQDLIMFCCLTTFILLKFKVCQFLKMFENYSKCPIWIFEFWHFPPFFVLSKVTCLVTLFGRKLQDFKTHQNILLLAFWINFCPFKM